MENEELKQSIKEELRNDPEFRNELKSEAQLELREDEEFRNELKSEMRSEFELEIEAEIKASYEDKYAHFQTEEPEPDDGLISVYKNGEKLRINPASLKNHAELGWTTNRSGSK